jgi:hypothetical protein
MLILIHSMHAKRILRVLPTGGRRKERRRETKREGDYLTWKE